MIFFLYETAAYVSEKMIRDTDAEKEKNVRRLVLSVGCWDERTSDEDTLLLEERKIEEKRQKGLHLYL